jgi:hypothetical protein
MLFFTIPLIAQSSRPIVSSISATINDDNSEILISWKIPKNALFSDIDFLRVYRQSAEFSETQDISKAQLIGTVDTNTTSINDPVTDYKNYWYAVIAQKNDGSIFDILVPSVNTTVLPCKLNSPVSQISAQQEDDIEEVSKTTEQNGMRETPLPCLHILPLQTKKEAGNISAEALLAAKKIETQSPQVTVTDSFIFDKEEQGQNTTGDDYSLYFIIHSNFPDKNWHLAETELIQFLEVARPDEVTARANFYIGESLYFQNRYKEAINYFLSSEKIYKPTSRIWLEKTLNQFNYDTSN